MTLRKGRLIDDFRHPAAARRRFVMQSARPIGRKESDCTIAGPCVK
jgi:hypothetical protein